MRFLGSITNRIFLASALLAMLSIGAAVYFVSARITAQTEIELQGDLNEAATLVDDQRRTQFENFARTARLIADLPKLKAAVDIADRPTLAPIAADYQLLIDLRGNLRSEAKAAAKDNPLKAALFAQTDFIRARLAELGVALEDRPGGTTWRVG